MDATIEASTGCHEKTSETFALEQGGQGWMSKGTALTLMD